MAKYSRNQVASIKIENKDYPIYEGVNTIGRNKDAVVNIKNINISQNHAILVVVDNKHYLSDIGSSNLTYHNGVKLIPFLMCQLANESKIKFGNVNGSYHILDNPTERPNNSRLEMTQDMTQGFYNSDTQIFQDITNLEATQKIDFHTDIHEAATQEMDLTAFKMPGKPAPRKSNESQSQGCDIHDAATQLFDISSVRVAQCSTTNAPSTSKTTESENDDDELTQPLSLDTTKRIAEISDQTRNIHEECTQVADLKACSETGGSSNHSTESLSLETRRKISEIIGVQNVWDQPTQVVDLKRGVSQNQESQLSEIPNLDVHENYMDNSMETQHIFAEGSSRPDQATESADKMIHQAEESSSQNAITSSKPDLNENVDSSEKAVSSTKAADIPDSTIHPDKDDLKEVTGNRSELTEDENRANELESTDSSATNISTTLNSDESDNDATDCEDNVDISVEHKTVTAVHNDTSNESLDFLNVETSVDESRTTDTSFKVVELEPLYEDNVEEKDGVNEKTGVQQNSGSDTDDEIIRPRKRKSRKILETQEEEHSDSDTDSDIEIPTKKVVKPISPTQKVKSDSDTDCSDIELKKNMPVKPLKPTQLSPNGIIVEDSYIIDDGDSGNESPMGPRNKRLPLINTTIPESQVSFNDSDCVPATQEVLARSILEKKKNNSQENTPDSFKLVFSLTEKFQTLHNSQIPCCSKSLVPDDDGVLFAATQKVSKQSLEDDDILFGEVNSLNPSDKSSQKSGKNDENPCSESMDALILSENTQKIDSQKSNNDKVMNDDEFYLAATQKTNIQAEANLDQTHDSLYIQATQKLPENTRNKRASILEKVDDVDDSFYLQSTQQISENVKDSEKFSEATQHLYEQATQKLAPISEEFSEDEKLQQEPESSTKSGKKFNFKKTKLKLNASLNTCLKPNTPKVKEIIERDEVTVNKMPSKPSLDALEDEDVVNTNDCVAETDIIPSLEVPLSTQLEVLAEPTDRPADPISTILDNDAVDSAFSDSSNKMLDKSIGDMTDMSDFEGFSKKLEDFKGVLADKKSCVGTDHKDKSSNKVSNIRDIEKLESQNQKMVEELLKDESVENLDVAIEDQNEAGKAASKKTSRRKLSSSSSKNNTPELIDAEDISKRVSKRLLGMDESTKTKNAKLSKKTSNLDDVFTTDNQESSKDESSVAKSKKDKKSLKPTAKRTLRSRGSSSSTKSKMSEASDTSDGEEFAIKNGAKRLKCVEESPVASKRPTRRRKQSTATDIQTEEQASDLKSTLEPSRSRRKILSSTTDNNRENKEEEEVVSKLTLLQQPQKRSLTLSSTIENQTDEESTDSKRVTQPLSRRRTENGEDPKLMQSPHSSTINQTKDESNDSKLVLQPPKKRTTMKKLLSEKDIDLTSDIKLKSTIEKANDTITTTVNSTHSFTSNMSMMSTANKSSRMKNIMQENLEVMIKPSKGKSMNGVGDKTGGFDDKNQLKLAVGAEDLGKKTRGGRGTKNTKKTQQTKAHEANTKTIQQTIIPEATTKTRGRKIVEQVPEKVETVTVIQNVEEKLQPIAASSKGRKAPTKRSADSVRSDTPSETGSVSGDSALSTPKKQRFQINDSALINSGERNRRRQKPKVVFTMLDSPQLESMIRHLGGSIVDSVEACTVLVTEHVKRTQKLLAAVGQGKPVCSSSWITESKKKTEFLDPWDHILIDKEAENKWKFSLKESIQRGSTRKLLEGYTFQIMANPADVLKGAIEACGGKCLSKLPSKTPNVYVIGAPEHKAKYQRIMKQNPEVKVLQAEAIFDGVLRQELRFEKYCLT